MPIRIECDGGCGAVTESADDFVTFGDFRKTLYCEECASSVKAFFTKRDELHETVAKRWQAGYARLKAAWAKEHEGGRLPDE